MGDALGQIGEVEPPLHLLLQPGLQLLLPRLKVLQGHVIAGLLLLLRPNGGQFSLQSGDVGFDGPILPLLLVAELQLLGAGGLLLGPLLSAGPGRLFPLRLCTGGQIV